MLLALLVLTLVKATPLVYAALGGVLAERSGVVNIGLEGMLTAGAFGAVAATYATGNPILGAACGVAAGALLGALLGVAATRWQVDQIVAGTGINIFALGAAAFGLVLVWGKPGASPPVAALGPLGDAALVALAFGCAALLHVFLFRTRSGLHVRACGENPRALELAGLDPQRIRMRAVTVSGALAGLAGVYLALAELDLYADGMSAGRGFIALAAVIFGRWTPFGATAAALAFGFFSALQFVLQRTGVPTELMTALPYLAALVALAGFAGRARAPAADGVPFEPAKRRGAH